MTEMKAFYSQSDCAQYLRDSSTVPAGTGEVQKVISDALASCFEEPPRAPPHGTLGLMVRRWVVRGDDLKLYDEFVRAVTAAAGASFFMDHAKLPAAGVGVAVALVSVFRNAWRAAANVTSDEWIILLALKGKFPVRPRKEELVSLLSGSPRRDGSAWSLEAVQKTLARLEKYPTRSGVKKFVTPDGDGGWGLESI